MTISVNWNTQVIHIEQSDLTLISGTLYELDVDSFRLTLKNLEDGEGMPFLDTHRHNTEVTIAGATFARTIEIINGYSVEFEDGQYSVRLTGANNNIFDVESGVLVQNQVQVIPNNSAGLISQSVLESLITEVHKRLDLDSMTPNTYANDNSEISNSEFTLTKSDNGNGTFTVVKS